MHLPKTAFPWPAALLGAPRHLECITHKTTEWGGNSWERPLCAHKLIGTVLLLGRVPVGSRWCQEAGGWTTGGPTRGCFGVCMGDVASCGPSKRILHMFAGDGWGSGLAAFLPAETRACHCIQPSLGHGHAAGTLQPSRSERWPQLPACWPIPALGLWVWRWM